MINKSEIGSSPLGLGCWPVGGDQWGNQSDDDSIATIRQAFDLGIRHFDTAFAYGRGHGEELLGKSLESVRDKVFIATKIFYMPKVRVAAAIEVCLRRLRTQRIDLLYIHWPKKGGDLAGMMEALESARKSERIRSIGVSNFSIADMQEVMKAGVIDAHQLCYNLLWRRAERETIPFCRAHGIAIITYSSLAEGILTGKFDRNIHFAPNDHRNHTVLFEPGVWPRVFDSVEKLKAIAAEARRPLGHCVLRWLMSREGVTSVLAGARNPEQVITNYKSLEGEIDQSVFDRMTAVSDDLAPHIPDAENIFRWYP